MATNNYYFDGEEEDDGLGWGTALGATALAGLAATPIGRPLRSNLRQLGGKVDKLAQGHISQAGRGLSNSAKEAVDTMLAKRGLAKGDVLTDDVLRSATASREHAMGGAADFFRGGSGTRREGMRLGAADARRAADVSPYGPNSWRNMPALLDETWAGTKGFFGGQGTRPATMQHTPLRRSIQSRIAAENAGLAPPSANPLAVIPTANAGVIDAVAQSAQRKAQHAAGVAAIEKNDYALKKALEEAREQVARNQGPLLQVSQLVGKVKPTKLQKTAEKTYSKLSPVKKSAWNMIQDELDNMESIGIQVPNNVREGFLIKFGDNGFVTDAAARNEQFRRSTIAQMIIVSEP